jgi:hypothetical protein
MINCGCSDCLGVIPIPCCETQTTTVIASAGIVLHNDNTESVILTANSWQNFFADKTYAIPITQLSIGDRLKVDAVGSAQMLSNFNKYLGVRLVLDGTPVATAAASIPHTVTGYFKISTVLDVVGATGSALNIKSYTRYEYSWSDPKVNMVSAEFNIEEKDVTTNYSTAPAKNIYLQGIISPAVVDATNFIKINQFCIEYFKKV